MKDIQKLLEGKKTYIAIAILFVLGGLQAVGAIDEATATMVRSFAEGLLGIGLYSKLSRNMKK